jgi:ectoine hydroxylase-related dioxygenase (phytanoyl-CoA dioxygenase family)
MQELQEKGYLLFPLGPDYESDIDHAKHVVQHNARMWNILNEFDCFRRIILHPKIIEIVREVYGSDFHLTSYSSNTIPKGKVSRWHTDHPYYQGRSKYKDIKGPLSLQVNISLDDFTAENGATNYISDSHRFESPPHHNVSQFICPKGTVMMYVGNLWHCGGTNKTDKPRSALLSNFCPLEVDGFSPHGALDLWRQIRRSDPDFEVVNGQVRLKIKT